MRIASLSERLSSYQEDQKAIALLAIDAIRIREGLSRKKLICLPLTARTTILSKWLQIDGKLNISSKQLEEISQRIDSYKPSGSHSLPQGWQVSWSKELVSLSRKSNCL